MTSLPQIVCETSNSTVTAICCAQFVVGTPVTTTTPTHSMPWPNSTQSACIWTAGSNSSAVSEIESWLHCADTYNSTTGNSTCIMPVNTSSTGSAVRSIGLKSCIGWFGILAFATIAAQTSLTI